MEAMSTLAVAGREQRVRNLPNREKATQAAALPAPQDMPNTRRPLAAFCSSRSAKHRSRFGIGAVWFASTATMCVLSSRRVASAAAPGTATETVEDSIDSRAGALSSVGYRACRSAKRVSFGPVG